MRVECVMSAGHQPELLPELSEEAIRLQLLETLRDLVRVCESLGYVPTVEQQPLKPLAMGHYRNVVELRLAREPAR